jgi:hypothetical protein
VKTPVSIELDAIDQWPRTFVGMLGLPAHLQGLDQNEVPAILERGEEILARNNPRNAMNGGGQTTQHIQVVNAIDHESIVRHGLAAPANTKIILNMMRQNKLAIKAALV